MIILMILTSFFIGFFIWARKIEFAFMVMCMSMIMLIFFPVSDYSYDSSDIELVETDFVIECFKAHGSFWREYIQVDCDSNSVDLTKNVSKGYEYYNKITGESCDLMKDCATKHKNTWWQKWR